MYHLNTIAKLCTILVLLTLKAEVLLVLLPPKAEVKVCTISACHKKAKAKFVYHLSTIAKLCTILVLLTLKAEVKIVYHLSTIATKSRGKDCVPS